MSLNNDKIKGIASKGDDMMGKETCNKCGSEVINDRKLNSIVWNCPNCGLEEYKSVDNSVNTFHYTNSIKQEELRFLITDIQSESDEWTWIHATEQITNTAVSAVIPNSKKYTKSQIRELLLSDYNEIQTKNNSRFPEIGEIL